MADLLLTFPLDDGQARLLRGEIREWCAGQGISQPLCEDVSLLASELFSNAVRASTGASSIDVRVALGPGALTVAVRNFGAGFDLASLPGPGPTRSGGRGIAIARLLGSVTVDQAGELTTVSVVLDDTVIDRG